MITARDLALPPKTQPAAAVERQILITHARASVEVNIPTGAAGLVGVQLYDRGRLLAPYGDTWLKGEGLIRCVDNEEFTGPPFYVVVRAYNADDTYTHTIQVRVIG